MNFTNAVTDLSGAIPSTGDLSQWVNDGVLDVIARIKATSPGSLNLFAQEVTVADGGQATENTTVLYVHRDSVNCRLVDGKNRHAVVDSGSLSYATASDPVYFIHEGKVYVKPVSGSSVKASVVKPGTVTGIAGTSAIANFPSDKYNLVVMYAALQVLHHRMIVFVMPSDLSLESLTSLSISTTVPTAPSAPSFSVSDAQMQNITGVITKSLSGTAPTYTPPVITNAEDGGLSAGADTDMDVTVLSIAAWTALDFDFDNENIDFLKWFQVAGDMIQNQEDVALASMQLQKISTYLNAYNIAMQNKLNTFNEANVEYQANLQKDMAELNSQLQADISKMNKSTDLDIQNKAQDLQIQLSDYNSQIAKYQAEIGSYQQQINASVGEYGQNLQRIAETNSSKIQDFGARVQKASGEYQWIAGQYATIKAQYEQSFVTVQ